MPKSRAGAGIVREGYRKAMRIYCFSGGAFFIFGYYNHGYIWRTADQYRSFSGFMHNLATLAF